MYFKKETYKSDMEILVTPANLVTFSGTIVHSYLIESDEHGKRYVRAGSLIDADGNVVTQKGNAGAETLSGVPTGVLYETVDITNGDVPCSLIVEGYLREDRVLAGFADKVKDEIRKALPKITFK